jgi:serine O-acetyltransferase
VLLHPGVRILHGHVVIDGLTEVHSGVQIRPFVTIGRKGERVKGPTIHRDVKIGTGAKVLGPVTIGERAQVGANAVVIDDVAPGAVVVGAPARPVSASERTTRP